MLPNTRMVAGSLICLCICQVSPDSVMPNLRLGSAFKWLLVICCMWVKAVKANIYGTVM